MVPTSTSIGADRARTAARSPRPDRWPLLLVALAAVAAAAAVWWSTAPWGAGLSPDAIAYSSIAENLRHHGELGYWLEPRVSSWPPLFPIVLAAVSSVTGMSAVEAGRLVNAVLQGAIVVVAAALAWRLLRRRWLRGIAVLVAAIAEPIVAVTTKVWSEPLFVVLVLLGALVLAESPGRRPRARVLLASALIAAGFMTRYAGLVFVPAGALVLAVWPRETSRGSRARAAARFGLPAVVAAVALVLWNVVRTGDAFGPRWRPVQPFYQHAVDAWGAVGTWFIPSGTARGVTVLVGAAVLAAIVAVLILGLGRRSTVIGLTGPAQVGVAPVLAVFVVCYFVYMVWARTTSGFDPLNSRLMLPILLPVVLLLLRGVEWWADRVPTGQGRVLVLVLPAVVLLPAMLRGIDVLRTSRTVGNEYTNAAVRSVVASPILHDLPTECTLFTNDPWLLWLAGSEAQLSPESNRHVAIPLSMTLDQFEAQAQRGDVCIVWFDTGSTVFYRPDQLAADVPLRQLDSDGFTTIYRTDRPA